MGTACKLHNTLCKQIAPKLFGQATTQAQTMPRPFFRGSETAGCGRKLMYGRRGTPPSNPFLPDVWEKMRKGDLIHDRMRKELLPLTDFYLGYEEDTVEGVIEVDGVHVHLKGHIDGVLQDRKTGKTYLLEIKSTSNWGYKASCKALDEGDDTHYSHKYIVQANRYVHLWNANWDPQLEGICLVLYNVDGQADPQTGLCMRDYWFEPDPELFEEDLRYLASIERMLHAGEEPKRGYEKIGWECVGCQWFSVCWPSGQRAYDDPKLAAKARELEAQSRHLASQLLSPRTGGDSGGVGDVPPEGGEGPRSE